MNLKGQIEWQLPMELIFARLEGTPLYLSLYLHIRALIQEGSLKDGEKLPSIRMLREQTKLSKTTIETAYHMLLEEGYVHSRARAGLYVVQPNEALAMKGTHSNPLEHRQSMMHRHASPAPQRNERVIDFSLLAIDAASFPIRPWKAMLHEALAIHYSAAHQYGDPSGELGLRLELASYLKRARGVNCNPEQLLIGSGLSYSIHILSKLLEGKHTVGIEAGGFAQVSRIFEQHGFRVIPVSFDCMDRLVTELTANAIQALYVTPSHRPSAKPLPYAARKQLLRWAADNSTHLIEDDYDGDFRYTGKTLPSLQSLDEYGSVIYVGTYSKAFTPALRMNYTVVPPQLYAKLKTIEYALASPSRIDQWAMQLFMERGHWYRHVRRMRNLYRGKHAKLLAYLRCYLPQSLKVSKEAAGLYVEITVNAAVSEDDLVRLAANEDVIVYGPQNLSRPINREGVTIYLGFGGLTDHEMEQGVQLLARAWSNIFAHQMDD